MADEVFLVLSGPIAHPTLPRLCEHVRALLLRTEAPLVICDVGALVEPDAGTIDALARLQAGLRQPRYSEVPYEPGTGPPLTERVGHLAVVVRGLEKGSWNLQETFAPATWAILSDLSPSRGSALLDPEPLQLVLMWEVLALTCGHPIGGRSIAAGQGVMRTPHSLTQRPCPPTDTDCTIALVGVG